MSFENLNLHEGILKALSELGFTSATPIQIEAIPQVLAGCDLRASAQTGTGKTAAFLLPALQRLTTPSAVDAKGPRILILVPTRELAMQVANEATKFSKYLPRAKTVCIYGGAPYPIQNRELSRHYEILVATPGRLIDHMERGRIDFSRLEMMILDEADRMLDMGFIEPVEQIAAATPATRQTLMFSATLKGSVMNLSRRLLNKPIEISVSSETEKHENIEQRLHFVDNLGHKDRLLDHILNDPTMNQAIVFTSTKRHADQLVDQLNEQGHDVAALHGDMNQRQRTRTITLLRQGKIKVLVATDVAARGIDVLTISHVINFDLPNGAEDYVHRIGRTGRAGGKGVALSFAASRDMQLVKRIEQFTGQKLVPHEIAGMEPKQKMSVQPSRRPSGGSGAPRGRFEGGGRSGSGRFGSDRPARYGSDSRSESRPQSGGRFENDSRPPRAAERSESDSRPPRTGGRFESDSRPSYAGRSDADSRPARPRFESDSRPPRTGGRFESDSRPSTAGRSDPDTRTARSSSRFESDSRPPRSGGRFDSDNRSSAPARFGSDSRPAGGRAGGYSGRTGGNGRPAAAGAKRFSGGARSPQRQD